MPVREPSWWYGEPDARVRSLQPAAWLYGAVAERRYRRRRGYRSRLPVICIGNLTAGGTGKTPLALLVAEYLLSKGERPAFLTRGHGGRVKGPYWVGTDDLVAKTGDEPLLLARMAPTMIARDRKEGALVIERAEFRATVIVMDDGLQNPALVKDLTVTVVDGARGIGNGLVIPAGPLRAPFAFQMALVDAVVVNGPPGATESAEPPAPASLFKNYAKAQVLIAEPVASGDADWLQGARVVAYAGIGVPSRFFDMLKALGAEVVETRVFRDHHPFSEGDARDVLKLASKAEASLVTTEKDWVRLSGHRGERAKLRVASRTFPIRLVFRDGDGDRIAGLIDAALASGGYRAAQP